MRQNAKWFVLVTAQHRSLKAADSPDSQPSLEQLLARPSLKPSLSPPQHLHTEARPSRAASTEQKSGNKNKVENTGKREKNKQVRRLKSESAQGAGRAGALRSPFLFKPFFCFGRDFSQRHPHPCFPAGRPGFSRIS